MKRLLTFAAATALVLSLHADQLAPPMAKKQPKSVTLFGDTRVDDYGWIRDKNIPDAVAYLSRRKTRTPTR